MKKTLIKPKQQTLLHANACMISVKEMLDLIATTFTTGIELTAILDNHQAAIAEISDTQITAYIDEYKHRASASDSPCELFSFLNRLAYNLRTFRNNAQNQNAAHRITH